MALGDLVSAVDVGALTGDLAANVAASFRQALANGIWGWSDDDLAFTRSWGFDLAGINVPVVVWQGGQDRMVDHGRQVRRDHRRAGRKRSHGWSLKRLATPLAIRLLLRGRSGCDRPDCGPDPTCGDAPREHQPDGSCLTTDLAVGVRISRGAHHQPSSVAWTACLACLASQRAARQLRRLERRALARFMA